MVDSTEIRAPKSIVSLAMLLAGALLVGFSMGRWLAPLAAWIGPILIMRYARDHKAGRGYLLVLAACIVAVLIGFIGIWLGGLPPVMVPFLVLGIGLLWSLPYLADRLLATRLRGFSSTFVFPLAATTLEFLFIHFNPLGTWGAWGFTQYGNLPLMQLASVTGMIGITFLMAWSASVANYAWENRTRVGEILAGLAAFGVVFAAVFLFGFLRLNLAPTSEMDATVRVAGITAQSLETLFAGEPDPSSPEFGERLQSYWDSYFEASAREARAGARVIVWPELAGVTLSTDEASYLAQAREVARQNGIYLAIPLNVGDPDTLQRLENKLVVIDPTGASVIEHLKYGGAIIEPGRTGDGILQTVATPSGVLSGVICWDVDFPVVIQQAGRNGTGLMLVPSNDWYQIDPVHSHMAVFRAIENGMSLVRQTHGGLSIAVDPYGRVLAQTDFYGATDRTMVAQVPVRHVTTIYTLFGRWFEWICLAGFLFVVAWAVIARRQVS